MKEILLFGKALENKYTNQVFDERFVTMAAQKGYIIHPDCDYNRVKEYLKTLPDNRNTSFYKSFDIIKSLCNEEIIQHRMSHYASTYGKFMLEPSTFDSNNIKENPNNLYIDFTDIEDVYIQNKFPTNPVKIETKDCKVMLPISKDEIFHKIDKSFKSGIALKKDTIENMFELSDEIFGEKFEFNTHNWKNKEAIILYKLKKNWSPIDNEEFIRMLVYITTNDTLVIQDKMTIQTIKNSNLNNEKVLNLFKNYDLTKLSESFNRYKKLFLAVKKVDAKTINKISSLSKKHHKPMELPFVSTFLNKNTLDLDVADLNEKRVILSDMMFNDDVSIFQKEKWLQAIRKRMFRESFYDSYNIRNGKSFYSINHSFNNLNGQQRRYLDKCYHIIYNSMVKSIKEKTKDCNIILPLNLNLVVPTSEKNFIGHIPFNSYIDLDNSENNYVIGINWKGKDGAQDLDLSYLLMEGKIGWNSDYIKDDIIYSGDMTSANPEASELFYFPSNIKDGIISVNNYNGKPESLYHFFIAKDHTDYNDKCVNPKNIIFETPLYTGNKQEQKSIGIFIDSRFYFVNRNTGYGRISEVNETIKMMIRNQSYACKLNTLLEDLLKSADASINYYHSESIDKSDRKLIDLTVSDKTVLLDLLS